MECKDCKWWDQKTDFDGKGNWRKCSNPNAPGYRMWREANNRLCKGYGMTKEKNDERTD